MTDDESRPARTDDEIQRAVWTCVVTFLPTDPTQVESNALGLTDALLADWTSEELVRLIGTLAALTANFYRTLEANHKTPDTDDEEGR